MNDTTNNFTGVFYFTNATKDDFSGFWNNKEYSYPAGTCCPMIIANETQENIQEIRKKFAYKLAQREFHNGTEYARLVLLGNKSAGGLPPTYDEKILEPMIEQCLKPLPIAQAVVKEGKKDSEKNYKASKAVDGKASLTMEFKDDEAIPVGKMSETLAL